MVQEKIAFEQLLEAVDISNQPFVQELHSYMIENGCKVTFEEKKSGLLASYKRGKPLRAFANFLFRKQGMLVRIYGENASKYADLLNTMPQGMVKSIDESGVCKRLVHNTCSPKCSGYDFMIGDAHYQKCRYNCFEFFVSEENNPYIKSFIEHELRERTAGQII